MTTYISFTSTGGRIGRIQWANTVPFSRGTIWGQVQWDTIWPKTPADLFSERLRLTLPMNQLMTPVMNATAALSEFARAMDAAAVEAKKIDSPYVFDTSLKEIKRRPNL